MSTARIPPIQCLLTFEALARLRSVTLAAEELCVTPSAVSHRVRQLEQILGTRLFGRADFSLTTEGSEYLAHVREGLASLQRFPGQNGETGVDDWTDEEDDDDGIDAAYMAFVTRTVNYLRRTKTKPVDDGSSARRTENPRKKRP